MRTAYKNPAIHRAFDMLETLSADETVRHLARVREDALRNERSELFYAEKKGLEKGRQEGRQEGELVGKIHLAQRLMKQPLTSKKKLLEQGQKELKAILKQLEAELKV
jgi:flagellar biosynthesis/type III secretory pathway protein FliH